MSVSGAMYALRVGSYLRSTTTYRCSVGYCDRAALSSRIVMSERISRTVSGAKTPGAFGRMDSEHGEYPHEHHNAGHSHNHVKTVYSSTRRN